MRDLICGVIDLLWAKLHVSSYDQIAIKNLNKEELYISNYFYMNFRIDDLRKFSKRHN